MAIYSALLVSKSTPNATTGKAKFIAAEGKGVARKRLETLYPGYLVTNLTRHDSAKAPISHKK